MSGENQPWTEVTASLPDVVWYLSTDGSDMWCRVPYGFLFSTPDAALAFASQLGTELGLSPIGIRARDLLGPEALDGLRKRALTRLFVDPRIDAVSGDVHGTIVRIEGPPGVAAT